MSLRKEIESLQRSLEVLSGQPESDLARRYALRVPPPERTTLYRRLRMTAGMLLRRLGLRRTPLEPWLPGLNHVESSVGARPLVIWAFDTDCETLRAACRGFDALCSTLPGFVPVLITDVPDFAYFSRLGWLVEYVPALSPPAEGYAERKRRYLAWRYRDAPALPVSAALTQESIEVARSGIAQLTTA